MIEPKLKEVGLRKDNYATMLSLRARSKITWSKKEKKNVCV